MSNEDNQAVGFLVCMALVIPFGAWLVHVPLRYVAGTELLFIGCLFVWRYVTGKI